MTELVVHGVYQHYKGDYYVVEDVARHTEDDEELVLYRALYGEHQLWARPKGMFLGEVEPGKPRFKLIRVESVRED